jgi:hypothetical protein
MPGVIFGGIGRGLGSPLLVVFDTWVCDDTALVVVFVPSRDPVAVVLFEASPVVDADPSELSDSEAEGLGVVLAVWTWVVGLGAVLRAAETLVCCLGWRA